MSDLKDLLQAYNISLMQHLDNYDVRFPQATIRLKFQPADLNQRKISQDIYRFATFDIDEPKDVITQSIPCRCSVEQSLANIYQE